MHACLEHQEIKNCYSQSPGGGQRSSPLCSLLPKTSPQFCMLLFYPADRRHYFQPGDHRRAPSHQSTSCSRNRRVAQEHQEVWLNAECTAPHEAPASHMQGALAESWKWSVCWQLFAETGGIDYLLGVVWGCLGTLSGLSNSIPLYSIALFVSYRTKWMPLGRMPANVQTSAEYLMRPQWHRESVNGYLKHTTP